ncbi:glycosyltransferase family 4 protein [Bradyrhizobium manausense]|uniref:glycosyltransferase family 4 protein n=1 Tax=Bradyrhizobium TaxID=374 RepID=UPI001BADBC85|nr:MULTISPECIES: glycosyltransferase family 4 protein [Bradyrhizobium]MBR0829716.1 glycosyltransferase family 4 protein [Bradyrhizobium manausense]UVO25329.1 glycosyltransferase family 4 protein [Bradyrhizobium arachidis]
MIANSDKSSEIDPLSAQNDKILPSAAAEPLRREFETMPGRGGLKVCHLVSSTNGARWAVEQLTWLRDRYGHDVTAVVSGPQGSLIEMLRDAGIRIHVEEGFGVYDSVASVLRLPLTVWRLARWLRRERFDVVQSHLFFAMIATRFAAWFADVPVRLAMYASPFHLEVPRTLWMDRLAWWMDTRLIASCQYTEDIFARLGVASRRRALIYYGADNDQYDPERTRPVDLRAEYGWPSSTNVVVKVAYFYARLSDNDWVPAVIRGKSPKGFDDLIAATPRILAEFPDTRVVLVGNGWGEGGTAYMQEMRQLVDELGLSEKIVFAGFRRDTAGILRGADVAVQASLYENIGGVIESLMVTCPTVATSVCGMVDCVIDGETGIQVRPSDPADLARGIKVMLADRVRARALAANGHRLMQERFSLARTCKDLDQLYRSERSATRRRFYNPLVSVGRCLVGIPVLAWFVGRVAYRDFYLPSHWPSHRNRLQQALDMSLGLKTNWRPLAGPPLFVPLRVRLAKFMPLRIRLANRRVTARLYLARWRLEWPMYVRMYRQRLVAAILAVVAPIRGRLITACFRLTRWRLEAPMYTRMYRHQLASWLGSRAPGWGVLRRLAGLKRRLLPKPLLETASYAPAVEPAVRDEVK